MINDVFRGKCGSCNRFLVENIIVKGTVPKRKECPPGRISLTSDIVMTFPQGIPLGARVDGTDDWEQFGLWYHNIN